jgi:hypothetical protein
MVWHGRCFISLCNEKLHQNKGAFMKTISKILCLSIAAITSCAGPQVRDSQTQTKSVSDKNHVIGLVFTGKNNSGYVYELMRCKTKAAFASSGSITADPSCVSVLLDKADGTRAYFMQETGVFGQHVGVVQNKYGETPEYAITKLNKYNKGSKSPTDSLGLFLISALLGPVSAPILAIGTCIDEICRAADRVTGHINFKLQNFARSDKPSKDDLERVLEALDEDRRVEVEDAGEIIKSIQRAVKNSKTVKINPAVL